MSDVTDGLYWLQVPRNRTACGSGGIVTRRYKDSSTVVLYRLPPPPEGDITPPCSGAIRRFMLPRPIWSSERQQVNPSTGDRPRVPPGTGTTGPAPGSEGGAAQQLDCYALRQPHPDGGMVTVLLHPIMICAVQMEAAASVLLPPGGPPAPCSRAMASVKPQNLCPHQEPEEGCPPPPPPEAQPGGLQADTMAERHVDRGCDVSTEQRPITALWTAVPNRTSLLVAPPGGEGRSPPDVAPPGRSRRAATGATALPLRSASSSLCVFIACRLHRSVATAQRFAMNRECRRPFLSYTLKHGHHAFPECTLRRTLP
ncbi:unnamed protein product [Arctogadus glacialis]